METATTTLADSLLDDLDDLSDGDEGERIEQDDTPDVNSSTTRFEASAPLTTTSSHEAAPPEPIPPSSAILSDPNLQSHLSIIRNFSSSSKQQSDNDLIITSNTYLSKITTSLHNAYLSLCRAYNPKFPELEDLIPDPLQYKDAVKIIGNEMDMTAVNEPLNAILNANQVITISVAGSTTGGHQLSPPQLAAVRAAISNFESIYDLQTELTDFISSQMEDLVPNCCALIGPTLSARLLSLAGSLATLSQTPACNVQIMGQIKQNSQSRMGMSALQSKPHQGILSECDLVEKCPGYLKKKAVKVIAAKVTLAARCDFVAVMSGREREGGAGRRWREEVEKKIREWEEPDKARVLKALPKPDLTTKRRRGGKRMRHLKDRFAETELMKQANKRAFSTQVGEYGDDAMGLTLGMLDATGGSSVGQLRQKVPVEKKMRQANTKASRKRAIQMSSGATNGLASSMVFTPVQGLELVNPDAGRERVREANLKWFKEDAGFQSAIKKKG